MKHHAALPYAALPGFMASLKADTSGAARALGFIILTAARYGEAASAEWTEIDLEQKLWTVPAHRMKATRPHAVPLSDAALAILGDRAEGLIFASELTGRPFSDVTIANAIKRHTSQPATCHGFRSTFRDWAGDCTTFPREVAEAALAHVVGDETEAAYRRSTALEKRRQLMAEWANYCANSAADPA